MLLFSCWLTFFFFSQFFFLFVWGGISLAEEASFTTWIAAFWVKYKGLFLCTPDATCFKCAICLLPCVHAYLSVCTDTHTRMCTLQPEYPGLRFSPTYCLGIFFCSTFLAETQHLALQWLKQSSDQKKGDFLSEWNTGNVLPVVT